MSHPVKGVDHVFLMVNDLDESERRYAALGFTISPRGLHSAAKGTANHTIMFPDDYFELLGVLRETEGNVNGVKALREKGQGLHALACRIDDAAAAAEALGALGIPTVGLGDFSRPVPLPGGKEGVAAFSTVQFAPGEAPFGTVFMCQHKTREAVWLPELLTHPNTACGLGGMLALSDDPAADAPRFARLWAAGAVSESEGGLKVTTGPNSAPLTLMTPAAMAKLYPGIDLSATPKGAFAALRIKVSDMGAAAGCLSKAGIPSVKTAAGLAVPPAETCGTVLEFVPA